MNTYELLDSGQGHKLERFGKYILDRPCSQAVWKPQLPQKEWEKRNARFTRDPDNQWMKDPLLPSEWTIEVAGIHFKIAPTDFGHLGIFPEQKDSWDWIGEKISEAKKQGREEIQVLNLFAYSGGSTIAAARHGAHVCHLDASKGMVDWARENARISGLEKAPIRWIVDDAKKFMTREIRREKRYDAIILDPPTFGRGPKGEIFKIEEEIIDLLEECRKLLTKDPLFVLFSCHTPGFSPIVMHHLLSQIISEQEGSIATGEMVLSGKKETFSVPSGTYARWSR